MSTELKTGDLVLCKVGSFPPWPAVVFPQRYLRNDVYRKRKSNCIAVCFFNDPTYYWEQPHKLRELDEDIIKEFLSEGYKTTTQQDLIQAYHEADDYTTLNEFIVSRFTDENRLSELEGEDPDAIPQGEDPFLSKAHQRQKKSIAQQHPPDIRSDISENSDNTTTNSKKRKLKSEYEDIDNTGTKDPPIQKKSKTASTGKKKSKLDTSRKVEICLLFRRKIQKNLVQRENPPSGEELDESLKLLTKIQENLNNKPIFFDIEALRESKLHKLLKVIVNDENLAEFHPVCKNILIHWADIITKLKVEKLEQSNSV